MKTFFATVEIPEPINPQEAFFGDCTNAVKLYHKIKYNGDGTPLGRINYVDVCSLYPFINKYGKYPTGHLKILTKGFEEVSSTSQPYEDLLKFTVLPPRKLLSPVLPYQYGGKLLFPLWKTCTQTSQKTTCEHNEEDHALNGTWVTVELHKALEKGYKILKIFEVWHYDDVEQYHPTNNSDGGLFTQYVYTFMKMKLVLGSCGGQEDATVLTTG